MTRFLSNGWYCAAWSHELADDIVARRLLDTPVVLFRGQDGEAVALQDRCPHRFAPLSSGRVRHGQIVCGYHGLSFDASGLCTGSPFNKTVPPGASVRKFPTHERWGVIWFWPGDPALADPALLPDFAWLGNEPGPHGYLRVKANYTLLLDNLMDLSHIEFVHLRTFGGEGAFFLGEHSTEKAGPGEIWSRWWMPDVPTPAPAKPFIPFARVDHWQDVRWTAPSNCVHELGITPVGVGKADITPKYSAHLLTPETATTTHYFYSLETSGAPVSGAGEEMVRVAFEEEDGPMLESVQSNMSGHFWEERPLVLTTDASGILVRRTLEKLIREEKRRDSSASADHPTTGASALEPTSDAF